MRTPTARLSRRYISRLDLFRERCRGKKVLHLGCSSGRYIEDKLRRGAFLHSILQEEAQTLCGVDIDAASLAKMRDLGFENLWHGDAENLATLGTDEKFDVVVAGDLLEHLTCPGSMIEGVKRLLNPGGICLVSTVNAFGIHFQLRRWLGRYVEHFEHVAFYSPETLVHLFERHGYRAVELYGGFTEPPHNLRKKALFLAGKPLLTLAPVLAGTLVLSATPA